MVIYPSSWSSSALYTILSHFTPKFRYCPPISNDEVSPWFLYLSLFFDGRLCKLYNCYIIGCRGRLIVVAGCLFGNWSLFCFIFHAPLHGLLESPASELSVWGPQGSTLNNYISAADHRVIASRRAKPCRFKIGTFLWPCTLGSVNMYHFFSACL